MELVIYVSVVWFVIVYLFTGTPREEFAINIIHYMILLILTVSISTLFNLNLGYIDFTEDDIRFLAVVLNRNIVLPMSLVIFSSVFNRLSTYTKKTASIIILLILNATLELFNLKTHLFVYIRWNFIFFFLFSFLYIFISIKLNKWLNCFRRRGEL